MPGMMRFCRFELRTTDLTAARAFYAALLGDDGTDIVPLPAEAAARGARAHWLGHLGVEDVERTARAFAGLGATRLGPTRPARDGGEIAILRDPGGAVVALATPPPVPVRSDVVWHLLNTGDLERCIASYRDLLGWRFTERLDLGALGVFHPFAWSPGGASVGSMNDITQRPGVHPHWLFHFRVAALEPALARVRAAGGVVIGPMVLPGGERLAVCDDPQGAAFALREGPPGTSEGGVTTP
jgi:uncharacterized protein